MRMLKPRWVFALSPSILFTSLILYFSTFAIIVPHTELQSYLPTSTLSLLGKQIQNFQVFKLINEHLFQKVVKTVEGVKSDAIFSYLPPLNILAFIFLTPLSYLCSPRTLHTINVFCIRLTVRPILSPLYRSETLIGRVSQSYWLSRYMSDGNIDPRGRSDYKHQHPSIDSSIQVYSSKLICLNLNRD